MEAGEVVSPDGLDPLRQPLALALGEHVATGADVACEGVLFRVVDRNGLESKALRLGEVLRPAKDPSGDGPWGRNFGVGQRFDQPQHRAAADGHAEDSRQAGTGPTGKRDADRGRHRPQPLGPPTVPTGQLWKLSVEGPSPARGDRVEEPAYAQTESDPSASAGHISGKSEVGAVNPP
ncbi:hypothetical protein GCM10010433_68220 [Streptomyces pulveraceus]